MAKFTASYSGIGQMLRSEQMQAEMRARAERVKTRAEQLAPYDESSTDGSHYRDSFRVESSSRGGVHHDRAAARVINDDEAAFFIEYGNVNIVKHRVLGRALEAAG